MERIYFKDFIRFQRGFDLPRNDMIFGPFPVVGSTSIVGYHNEYKMEPPGVVTGRSGSLGTVQFIKKRYWPHNTSLWVKDFKGNYPLYVFYFLQTVPLAHFNSGAGVPTLNRNDLDMLEIEIHDKSTQRKIASILSAYDDLIENNTRRIKILEELTQRLYHEWFVHFRYPGHEKDRLVESEMGLIPEGWEVIEVANLLNRLPAGKAYTQKSVKEVGTIPVIDQSTNKVLGYHDNEPDHIATSESPIIIFGDHTCKMQLLIDPFSVGPNVIPFTAQRDVPIHFLYFLVNTLVETKEYKRHWNDLIDKEVVIPPNEIANQYAQMVVPIFEQINRLEMKCNVLSQTRNLLLPKLISGKIDVSELDIDTGDKS